jgi:hypothetical protein
MNIFAKLAIAFMALGVITLNAMAWANSAVAGGFASIVTGILLFMAAATWEDLK